MTADHFHNEPLRCPACRRRFWAWAEQHTGGKGKRGRGHGTALSFYESAARVRGLPGVLFHRWGAPSRIATRRLRNSG